MERYTEKELSITGAETGFYRIKKDISNTYVKDLLGNVREVNSMFLAQQILGSLEDLLEKYKIETLEQLESCLKLFTQNNPIMNIKDERVLKAIQYGFFKKGKTGRLIYISANCKIDFKNECFKTSSYNSIYFKDYGNTWALTTEELL